MCSSDAPTVPFRFPRRGDRVIRPAEIVARTAGVLSRRLGRGGGTSLPGKVLIRLRPGALTSLRRKLPRGSLVVSATNGKTTTSRLIVDCIRQTGQPIVTNPSGANLVSGVATALLDAPSASDAVGLFEVDEAALPTVVSALAPRVVVLMNLFRDQLDRFGELEHLIAGWRRMLADVPDESVVLLNADDPGVAQLADAHPNVRFFGIDATEITLTSLPHAADSTRCRRCGAQLVYDAVLLGHLGHWHCDECGWTRPTPDVAATEVTLDGFEGLSLSIRSPEGPLEVPRIALPGLHNAYNATAAAAAALALGASPGEVERGLAESRAAFGRSERIRLHDRELVLLLVKNPTGANEIVRTLELDQEPLDLVLILNDRTADGRDVSWIWDIDYEPLLPRIRHLTVAGDRAYDLALRFRYAGFPAERMSVVPNGLEAVDAASTTAPPGRPVYVLPTYTAMLALRRGLQDRGAVEAFWNDD